MTMKVVITGAGRDFGRSLAFALVSRGTEVFLSARTLQAAERTRDEIRELGHDQVHAFACDLTEPASINRFARHVAENTDHIDVLVNNGATYLNGADLLAAEDDDIIDTIASGATGTILMTKHFLPLLLRSSRPDIVTIVSSAGVIGHDRSDAHSAFYSAKSAQAGFTEILSRRLRPHGVRVISLYPPDFANPDPLAPDWLTAPRTYDTPLTSQSLTDCILFAIGQPRDCFIKAFHFEEPHQH